jgi:hypothetical protein
MKRSFCLMLMGCIALFSTLFLASMPASAAVAGIGISHSIDAPDWLAPIADHADALAVIQTAPDTPETPLIEATPTGPLSPVYVLSYQTNGASLGDFHRRC